MGGGTGKGLGEKEACLKNLKTSPHYIRSGKNNASLPFLPFSLLYKAPPGLLYHLSRLPLSNIHMALLYNFLSSCSGGRGGWLEEAWPSSGVLKNTTTCCLFSPTSCLHLLSSLEGGRRTSLLKSLWKRREGRRLYLLLQADIKTAGRRRSVSSRREDGGRRKKGYALYKAYQPPASPKTSPPSPYLSGDLKRKKAKADLKMEKWRWQAWRGGFGVAWDCLTWAWAGMGASKKIAGWAGMAAGVSGGWHGQRATAACYCLLFLQLFSHATLKVELENTTVSFCQSL